MKNNTYRIYFQNGFGRYYSVGGRNAQEAVRNAKTLVRHLEGVRRPVVVRIQRLCRAFERDLKVPKGRSTKSKTHNPFRTGKLGGPNDCLRRGPLIVPRGVTSALNH
jgi:hypothetical protein